MIVSIVPLFESENEEKELSFEEDFSDIEVSGVYPFKVIKAFVNFKSKPSMVVMKMDVNFLFSYRCDRCAKVTEKNISYSFNHKLVRNLNADYSDEYTLVYNDNIDLSALLREDILLEFPSKVLCKTNCKGICAGCGKNLNDGNCSCSKRIIDPRLEKLKELLK